ncbi:MFS transporter [Roseburia sp. MSJ-14]|uniref:MFS transporter n=1 Tax=Roseburia sp. MSJ-14 TaxID=2841514 RepID=UPI001C10F39F|nr:MFS transporter [Roseburia sp. MSJ-14]MBU5474167.1 MFS transporter [Roseburia sp. MSJ-14]
MKTKLTKPEKQWILYDVGNSAFILLVSTIIPIYFNYLADLANVPSVTYLAYWGYAASISTLVVALFGPILGTMADSKNFKKPLFFASILIGSICCAILGFFSHWLIFLGIYIIAKIAYNASLIFYDSMLTDVSTPEHMDDVSSQGYAWGYIGSCVPFIIGLVLVLGYDSIGISFTTAMILTFLLIAIWGIALSLPLLRNYRQIHYVAENTHIVSNSFRRLGTTLKNISKEKHILWFLIAFFFYIDGVYTIIEMATAYGQALGLNSSGLLIALLVTQLVAFPCAIVFGRLAQRYPSRNLITVCIVAYLGISIFALQLDTQWEFWFLAVCVGMFQGGIQALSRSYFAKIIPPEKSGEYFGIMDICGKGASFLGTTLVSVVSQISGSINIGVGSISVVFVIGLICFLKASALASDAKSLTDISVSGNSLMGK